jgi:hypothetical protein
MQPMKPSVGVMSCLAFRVGEPDGREPLHELPLPRVSYLNSATPFIAHILHQYVRALSRFLNEYGGPTRTVILVTRKQILKQLLEYSPKGKHPHLQVIIDLTALEVSLLMIEVESKPELLASPGLSFELVSI